MFTPFHTTRLVFRKARPDDIPFVMAMERHPDNRDFLWQGSLDDHLSELADPDQLILMMDDVTSGERVGYALIRFFRKADVFELRRIALNRKGEGYGTEAMKALITYAFTQCGINRFWLDVYPDNIRGIHLYEKLGMHRDGVLRQSDNTDRGRLDQIIYSLLKSEFDPVKYGCKQ